GRPRWLRAEPEIHFRQPASKWIPGCRAMKPAGPPGITTDHSNVGSGDQGRSHSFLQCKAMDGRGALPWCEKFLACGRAWLSSDRGDRTASSNVRPWMAEVVFHSAKSSRTRPRLVEPHSWTNASVM